MADCRTRCWPSYIPRVCPWQIAYTETKINSVHIHRDLHRLPENKGRGIYECFVQTDKRVSSDKTDDTKTRDNSGRKFFHSDQRGTNGIRK